MEQKLTEAFDALHMDDACAEQILQTMEQASMRSFRPVKVLRTAAVLCIALLSVSMLHPGVARAVEDAAERTLDWFRAAVSRGHGVTVVEDDYVYYNDGHMEVEVYKGSSVDITPDLTLAPYPVWLAEKDGRVYFLANMENEDITDRFSQEEPFLYVYDKEGITHYIAVGGNYDPEAGLSSVSYSQWLRHTQNMGEGLAEGKTMEGWLGGGGAGQYDPETGDLALWYAKAIVELNIPWNYLKAQEIVEKAE